MSEEHAPKIFYQLGAGMGVLLIVVGLNKNGADQVSLIGMGSLAISWASYHIGRIHKPTR